MDGVFSSMKLYDNSDQITEPRISKFFLKSLEVRPATVTEAALDGCGGFRSGDSFTKAKKGCSVSGVFGVVCSHGVILSLQGTLVISTFSIFIPCFLHF